MVHDENKENGSGMHWTEPSIVYVWKLGLYLVPCAILTCIIGWSHEQLKQIRRREEWEKFLQYQREIAETADWTHRNLPGTGVDWAKLDGESH
jgi:hypothetical protein